MAATPAACVAARVSTSGLLPEPMARVAPAIRSASTAQTGPTAIRRREEVMSGLSAPNPGSFMPVDECLLVGERLKHVQARRPTRPPDRCNDACKRRQHEQQQKGGHREGE